jgi:hypothetical protein
MVLSIDKTLYEFTEMDRRVNVAVCGDRAADVLAAQARWSRLGSAPAARSRSRIGAARRRLGTWLVELRTRRWDPAGERQR